MRFAHGMFGFLKVTLAELDSPRVKGAAHAMFVQKRARSQAPAIPVDVVKKLVGHAGDPAEEPHVSMIAGQLLKCVFGVGRWSDFRSAGGLEIDEFEGTVMWTMWTADHKAAISTLLGSRLLARLWGLDQHRGRQPARGRLRSGAALLEPSQRYLESVAHEFIRSYRLVERVCGASRGAGSGPEA